MKTHVSNWGKVNLLEIAVITTGNKDANYATEDGSFSFFTCALKPLRSPNFSFDGEALILPGNGANVGEVFYYNGKFEAYQRTYIIKDIKINARFLYYHLLCYWREKGSKLQYGSATNYIKIGNFISYYVDIPPLPEQTRIVAKLDAFFAHIDTLQTKLDRIPELLKSFRQQVLNQAVTGKLTEEWRKGKENIEKASILLERLTDKRIKINPKAKFFTYTDDLDKNKIPSEWVWTRLINIADIIGGVTKGRNLSGKKTIILPYLRVANVQDGYLDLNEIKEIEVLPEDKFKYKLLKGDILFTEGGDRDKLGRGTIWNNEIVDCIHQNHIFRARVDNEYIIPQYISNFTKSDIARKHFFENASQTVNLASINMTMLGKVPIALPPLEEQHEIIRRVEELFRMADTIEARYKSLKEKIDSVPQAILTKAFKGELVPQDPNDEPASVLLERIKSAGKKGSATVS